MRVATRKTVKAHDDFAASRHPLHVQPGRLCEVTVDVVLATRLRQDDREQRRVAVLVYDCGPLRLVDEPDDAGNRRPLDDHDEGAVFESHQVARLVRCGRGAGEHAGDAEEDDGAEGQAQRELFSRLSSPHSVAVETPATNMPCSHRRSRRLRSPPASPFPGRHKSARNVVGADHVSRRPLRVFIAAPARRAGSWRAPLRSGSCLPGNTDRLRTDSIGWLRCHTCQ